MSVHARTTQINIMESCRVAPRLLASYSAKAQRIVKNGTKKSTASSHKLTCSVLVSCAVIYTNFAVSTWSTVKSAVGACSAPLSL